MELAWDMLELARLGFSRQTVTNKQQGRWADTLSRLGDLSQTNDQFEKAVSDYQDALAQRKKQLELFCTHPEANDTKRALAAEH